MKKLQPIVIQLDQYRITLLIEENEKKTKLKNSKLKTLAQQICLKHDIHNLFAPIRTELFVNARIDFIHKAHKLGYSSLEISEFLGKDRSTIYYLLKKAINPGAPSK